MTHLSRNQPAIKRRWHADPFAMYKAIGRSTGFNESEQVHCALPVRLAWDALRKGSADADDIQTLADVIAICIVAAESMDELVQETCEAGRLALAGVADRFTRKQVWGVDANSLRDIPPVVELYEELLRNATGGQMERWMGAVKQCKGQMLGVVS